MGIANIHIDTHVPEGDTLVTYNHEIHTGSGSIIAGMIIMNSIIVETVRLLTEQGVPFHIDPSHNVSGNVDEVIRQEEALFEAHKQLIAKL